MAKKSINKEGMKSVYEMQAVICGALASPIRLQIIDLISQKEMTSSELLGVLQIPKANLSQHVAVLRDAGLIKNRKEGLFVYMTLAIPKIKEACGLVRSCLIEKISQEEIAKSEILKQLRAK